MSNYLENPDTAIENLQEVQPTALATDLHIWQLLYARIGNAAAGATRLQRMLYRWAIAAGARGGPAAMLARFCVLHAVRRELGLRRLRCAYIGGTALPADIARWTTALGITIHPSTARRGRAPPWTRATRPSCRKLTAPKGRNVLMRNRLLAAALATALIAPAMAADSARGVTDNEIVIGTYTDLSGVTAMWGVNNSNAWRMVFDDANAAGGINGRKIKDIVEDNQYQIPRSVQAANKLINRDGVFMMVANGGTPMNNATMPDQLAKGVPNVFPLTSARSMYEPLHHLKFGLASSYYDQMRAGVKLFVEQHHSKTICAMSQDTDFGRDVMDGARTSLRRWT